MDSENVTKAKELERQIPKQQMEKFNNVLIEELALEMLKERFNFSGEEGIGVPEWMHDVANENVHRYIEYLKVTYHA